MVNMAFSVATLCLGLASGYAHVRTGSSSLISRHAPARSHEPEMKSALVQMDHYQPIPIPGMVSSPDQAMKTYNNYVAIWRSFLWLFKTTEVPNDVVSNVEAGIVFAEQFDGGTILTHTTKTGVEEGVSIGIGAADWMSEGMKTAAEAAGTAADVTGVVGLLLFLINLAIKYKWFNPSEKQKEILDWIGVVVGGVSLGFAVFGVITSCASIAIAGPFGGLVCGLAIFSLVRNIMAFINGVNSAIDSSKEAAEVEKIKLQREQVKQTLKEKNLEYTEDVLKEATITHQETEDSEARDITDAELEETAQQYQDKENQVRSSFADGSEVALKRKQWEQELENASDAKVKSAMTFVQPDGDADTISPTIKFIREQAMSQSMKYASTDSMKLFLHASPVRRSYTMAFGADKKIVQMDEDFDLSVLKKQLMVEMNKFEKHFVNAFASEGVNGQVKKTMGMYAPQYKTLIKDAFVEAKDEYEVYADERSSNKVITSEQTLRMDSQTKLLAQSQNQEPSNFQKFSNFLVRNHIM